MKKLFTFLAGAALLGSLSACSSDEPAKGPEKSEIEEGTSFYLKVRVSDASTLSRADEPTEKDDIIEDGVKAENTLSHASFYFFDANKIFVTKARIINPNELTPANDENGNIELETDNVIVLQGLTKDNFPKYMLTVLNVPEILDDYVTGSVRTLDEVRDFSDGLTYLGADNNFVMSTTSFYLEGTDIVEESDVVDGNTLIRRYEPGVYGVNVVAPEDFISVKKGEDVPDLNTTTGHNVVGVYVERLAAKYTVSTPNDARIFKVRNYTIAGLPNEDTDEAGRAGTPVWVKIENFGVTMTESNSYLTKNIGGYDDATPWSRWNDASWHRSYWGKSVNYGKDGNYESPKYAEINGATKKFVPVYSNETTNTILNITDNNRLIDSKVTNFVVTAIAYSDEACTKPLDLVLYSGTYFAKEQFIKYILSLLNDRGELNYYIKKSTSESVSGGVLNKDDYTQISDDKFSFSYNKSEGTSKFDMKTNIGDETELYALTFDKDKLIEAKKVEDATTKINAAIEKIFKSNGYPSAYTNGAMAYYIPVEHLLNNDGTVTHEGQFGVVRNHWYELNIDKIMNLGQGVFDPNGETTETLVPGSSPESYALGARIKILSWKIVKQSVKL